jgi:hypothetical protein
MESKERLVAWGRKFLANIRRFRADSHAEATDKPCIALVTAARGYEDAVLGTGGAVGAMMVAAREGNVAIENIGNVAAINIRYEFRPVNPPPGANVARPQNYVQMLRAGETFVMPVARGLLNNLEYEFIANYESAGGGLYRSTIMLNNLVLGQTRFTTANGETKTPKTWTRADKIAFWALIVAILAIIVAVVTPEIRRKLALEHNSSTQSPPAPSKPLDSPVSQPQSPQPQLKRTTQASKQTGKASVKSHGNTAGNAVSGNGNVVGNNNQVNAAPGAINAPNGIAIGGNGVAINPTVNNFGLPLPNLSWAIEDKPPPDKVAHPQICVKISIDKMFVDAKFAVVCDRPCKAVRGEVILGQGGGMAQANWGTVPGHPEIAAFVVNLPNPMPSSVAYRAYVESEDALPVKIIAVRALTLTKP